MTIKTLVIISIYVSMFTAMINLVVDFLFEDILSAPTIDSTKNNKNSILNANVNENKRRESKEEKLSEDNDDENKNENTSSNNSNSHEEIEIRPGSSLSKSPNSNPNLKEAQLSSSRPTLQRLDSKKVILTKMKSGNFDLETTRVVPSSTQEAHALATISAKEIMKDRISEIKNSILRQDSRRQGSTNLKQKSSLEKYRESLKSRGESQQIKSKSHLSRDEIELEQQFMELTVDIMEQRKELKRSQQDGFDEMWGIDPTGEFSKQRQNYLFFWFETKSSANLIKKELSFVREETKKKCRKLEYASDVQTGLEILHYFILDLLGR